MPLLRYVPPGYLAVSLGHAHAKHAVSADLSAAPPLLFFGAVHEGRASCFQSLLDALGNQLRSTYDVWTDSRFDEVGLRPARVLRTPHDVCVHGPNVLTSFIAVARLQSQTMRQYDLFVNLHKGCGKRMPVTFRNAVLLNSAKLIVSDRCHPRDEEMYAGLITFAELGEIPDSYRALLAGNRTERQVRAHAGFRERFAPRRLFERAGIYQDWGLELLPSSGRIREADEAADVKADGGDTERRAES